tara:strand:+ start:1236 stop:1691 length:456 start_codon:yes stop_codon:yes gene_type:complete
MGMFKLGSELIKFAVSKGIPADFIYSLGKDAAKNPDANIAERIKNAYGDSITGSTINKIKKGIEQFYQKKADGGMMEARKKGMGLRMANGGEVPSKFKGFSKLPESVQEQMSPTLAKKYEKGGVVKKRVKRTKKSRGTGSAIKGTKFKGVF